ncbi:MAG: Zn-ribbon domain-containing OB-fold protein [Pyrodictiaceae archaeon]
MSQREEIEKFIKQVEEFVESTKKSTGLPIIPDQKTGVALWYDQRELRAKYTISVERIRKFYEGLMEGKLLATRCKHCGRIYFPPQMDCPYCRKSDMEWIELSKEGELLTYTVIYTKPMSFAHYNDYTVGIARLKEGVNVTAWVRETDPRKLRVGMKVKIEIVKREPEGYLTYEIVPAEEA